MNYIKQLQEQKLESITITKETIEDIKTFQAYLQSPKFYIDTTIQASEVHNFLTNIRLKLSQIKNV